jgi:NTP pyrophosphatase (non-canonical NTP hydrolase)
MYFPTEDQEAEHTFARMRQEVQKLNTDKGWRNGTTTFAEYVALLHSEVSEMLEEWRNKDLEELKLEYADVLIRLVDMADVFDVDIWQAYVTKMKRNWDRPFQHGGKTL